MRRACILPEFECKCECGCGCECECVCEGVKGGRADERLVRVGRG
jgi:hypothetical protein